MYSYQQGNNIASWWEEDKYIDQFNLYDANWHESIRINLIYFILKNTLELYLKEKPKDNSILWKWIILSI